MSQPKKKPWYYYAKLRGLPGIAKYQFFFYEFLIKKLNNTDTSSQILQNIKQSATFATTLLIRRQLLTKFSVWVRITQLKSLELSSAVGSRLWLKRTIAIAAPVLYIIICHAMRSQQRENNNSFTIFLKAIFRLQLTIETGWVV